MNKIQAVLVSSIIISILLGIFSVEGLVPIPTPAGLQTTSADISVLNVVPGLTFQPGNGEVVTTGIGVTSGFGGPVNATAAFSFAPMKGFTAVNTVLISIVYFGGTGGYNAFGVQLNGQPASDVPATTVQNSAVGAIRSQDIRVGSNSINIGIVLDGSSISGSTFVFQVRLTVEYNFVG